MNPEYLEVIIRKAIHGTYISIDKRKLIEAKRNHQMMKVTILGKGSAIVDPQVWWDTAVMKEERVVKYADCPMVFVYNYLDLGGKLKATKDLSVNQLQLI